MSGPSNVQPSGQPLSIGEGLLFIKEDHTILKAFDGDQCNVNRYINAIRTIFYQKDPKTSKLPASVKEYFRKHWNKEYDYVNPFGDNRGDRLFVLVVIFDFDEGVIRLLRSDQHGWLSIKTACEKDIETSDLNFVPVRPQRLSGDDEIEGPYWQPDLPAVEREMAFLGKIIHDFNYTWRHVLRHEMNEITHMKMAFALVWFLKTNFTPIGNRPATHSDSGPPCRFLSDVPRWRVPDVWDLPKWDKFEARVFRMGPSWFVLSKDIREGLDLVRDKDTQTEPQSRGATYVIVTMRRVALCRVRDGALEWTRAERLFVGDLPPSNAALHMLLAPPKPPSPPRRDRLNSLPVELQSRVTSLVDDNAIKRAMLACEVGLGTPFNWTDGTKPITRGEAFESVQRRRVSMEAEIYFGETSSGLAYFKPSENGETPDNLEPEMNSMFPYVACERPY